MSVDNEVFIVWFSLSRCKIKRLDCVAAEHSYRCIFSETQNIKWYYLSSSQSKPMYHQLSLKETSFQLRSPPAETREGETDTYTLVHTTHTAQACAQLQIMMPCEFWACRLLTCNHCILFLCLSSWKTNSLTTVSKCSSWFCASLIMLLSWPFAAFDWTFSSHLAVICCVYVTADSYLSVHTHPMMEANELLRIVGQKMDRAEEEMVLAVMSHTGGTDTVNRCLPEVNPLPQGPPLRL